MRGMVSYTQAAMERAMKVQEVILRAMAKRITWWQAAEIIGISDRQMRRWRERYEEFGYDGLFDRRQGKPSPKRVPAARQALAETGAGGAGGASAGALPRSVFRSERAAFPGEVAARAPDRAELHLGEAGVARSRTGAARAQARSASPAASAAASARDVVAHRRVPSPLVSG